MLCACGKYIFSTSTSPWSSYVMDEWGRIVEATCVHGMHFSFQEDNIINIRGGYNGEHNNNINGLISSNIGGIISDSPNRI